jgi:hypothetical protein
MKKKFETPEVEIILLEVEDVICYSLSEDELPPF